MRKTILAISASLIISISLYSQNINIPDLNFLNALINSGVDTNGNLEIDSLEASNISLLNLRKENISDLTGIEAFINLDSLDCSYNDLTSIDLSKNDHLKYLDVSINKLNSIDISNCTNLLSFIAIGNELTSLDVSNNIKLEEFHCSLNKLEDINITNNLALKSFGCSHNSIENLDLSQNLALEILIISNNRLQEVDITNHIELVTLNCHFNSISTLDVSNNKKLESLMCCCNNISDLNLRQNSELSFVDCSYNPLSSLDVSNNPKLRELNCTSSQLTSLDLSNNQDLLFLFCEKNSIQFLDLSNNLKLVQLLCSENQIDELNVFHLKQLEVLWCGDNFITHLDISRNKLLDNHKFSMGLKINNLPQLKELCVNELPFPPEGFRMDTTGSPNIQFTMNCTPALIASDTLYQPDSIELLCSQDGMVYLVPENTMKDFAEISSKQIYEFPVSAGIDSQHNMNNISGGTYWLYAVGNSQIISNPVPITVMSLKGLKYNEILQGFYPNPAKNYLEIETYFSASFNIEVFNINGILVKSDISYGPKVKLDISKLSSGIYLVKMKDKKSIKYFRFIKVHAF